MGITNENSPEVEKVVNRKINKSIAYIGVAYIALSCALAAKDIIRHDVEREANCICGDGRVGLATRWSFIEENFGLDDPLKIAEFCDAERTDEIQSVLSSIRSSEDVSAEVREKTKKLLGVIQ